MTQYVQQPAQHSDPGRDPGPFGGLGPPAGAPAAPPARSGGHRPRGRPSFPAARARQRARRQRRQGQAVGPLAWFAVQGRLLPNATRPAPGRQLMRTSGRHGGRCPSPVAVWLARREGFEPPTACGLRGLVPSVDRTAGRGRTVAFPGRGRHLGDPAVGRQHHDRALGRQPARVHDAGRCRAGAGECRSGAGAACPGKRLAVECAAHSRHRPCAARRRRPVEGRPGRGRGLGDGPRRL